MSIVDDLGRWLWRLLPGNPILVRVVAQGSQRARHNWARFAYLAAMFAVVLLFGSGALSAQSESLSELSKSSTQTFTRVSVVQLLLMAFIAPIFCAGAITQEKDSNTFHILLTTPLSTAQIVLGMLFSRIYFVWALLLSGLPIVCITMVFGGVTRAEVFEAFGLAACTGLVTGALAIMIGVAKVGTRRTIFSFFLGVAVYLLVIWAIGMTTWGQLDAAPLGPSLFGMQIQKQMSWLAPIHPFLALLVVTGQTPAPLPADVANYSWPWRWCLAYPQYAYMLITTLASATMVFIALWFVRRGAKEGELTWWSRMFGAARKQKEGGDRRKPPRRVWANPIAWREAATRASAAGRSTLRWAFIVAGAIGSIVLLVAHEQGWWGMNPNQPDITRKWLTAIVWIELAVILLLVTNIAATTLTREKETATLELLLTTPLTSRYILAGMLRGLVSFAVPMIAVPAFMLLLFVFADVVRGATPDVTTFEAFLLIPLLMTAFTAVAAMIGLYFSLQAKRTVQAVMISTVIVMGAAGLLFGCGMMLGNGGPFLAAITQPFTPFHAIAALIDLQSLFEVNAAPGGTTIASTRLARAIAALVAIGAYAALTYSIYSGMVRSFDMTIRRQSA